MPGLASVEGCRSATNGLVRVMKNTMQKAFIASLSALALTFAADASFARSPGAPGAAVRPLPPIGGHPFRPHRRHFVGPVVGGYYGPEGTPVIDGAPSQPAST